jgi:hypothetical protein
MPRFAVLLLLLVSASPALSGPRRVLRYGPRVTLEGRLRRVVFPGPPNYSSVKRGDTAETCYILQLSAPVDVKAGRGNEFDAPQKNVRDIQLAPSAAQFRQAAKLVNGRVRVTGTLFGEHTGHHHTPVLISVETLRAARR